MITSECALGNYDSRWLLTWTSAGHSPNWYRWMTVDEIVSRAGECTSKKGRCNNYFRASYSHLVHMVLCAGASVLLYPFPVCITAVLAKKRYSNRCVCVLCVLIIARVLFALLLMECSCWDVLYTVDAIVMFPPCSSCSSCTSPHLL